MPINQNQPAGVKIALAEKGKTHWVDITTITHVTCNGYLSTVHLTNSEKITLSRLLKQFEAEFTHLGFIRVNRNTLVNQHHVKQYAGGTKRQLLLTTGHCIEVSRRKVYLFKNN